MTDEMTLAELGQLLESHGLAMTVQWGLQAWVVYLFAPDDPARLVVSESPDSLVKAVRRALSAWRVTQDAPTLG